MHKKYDREILERLILNENKPYTYIGKLYGVSGNSIKKAAQRLGINVPKRRIVSVDESFNRNKKYQNKLTLINDDEFIKCVREADSWHKFTENLGYKSPRITKKVRNEIIERCNRLNISLVFNKNKDIEDRTKGDLFTTFKNWQSARSFIRRNSQEKYLKSGRPLKCKVCGYDKHVEIAHIKAVSEFSDETHIGEINSIDNLVALCPNHHWEYDNGILKL